MKILHIFLMKSICSYNHTTLQENSIQCHIQYSTTHFFLVWSYFSAEKRVEKEKAKTLRNPLQCVDKCFPVFSLQNKLP